jgi:hypothetical protein
LDIKKDVLPSLGLEDSQFDKTENGEVDYLKLQNNAGTLNPMLRK